jgi:cyclophilin family peptidyl-prolyl cis-trans isomerase
MGTAKRERQKQGRQVRIEAARAAQQRATRKRSLRNYAVVIVLIVVGIFLVSRFAGGNNNDSSTVAADSGSSTTAPTATTGPGVSITVPAAGAAITGDTPCPQADGSSVRTTTFAKAPPTCIDPAKTYTAQVVTSQGSFTIALDAKTAPITVNNFVVLARYHYFDGVPFHRIIPGFMDQTGDANGPTPGQGSPGYSIPDEPPSDASVYTDGAVAMANKSAPSTGGSQFFVVVDQGGQQLSPTYSKFGQVSGGLDVAKAINKLGTAGQAGTPTALVTITSVTITEA